MLRWVRGAYRAYVHPFGQVAEVEALGAGVARVRVGRVAEAEDTAAAAAALEPPPMTGECVDWDIERIGALVVEDTLEGVRRGEKVVRSGEIR